MGDEGRGEEVRIALVTTTIHTPHALALLRKYDPEVRFFVAGDENSSEEGVRFCETLDNTEFLLPKDQTQWGCSKYIGWNCIQRRAIAVLEALRWGADIIVSWDDDNLPLDGTYFFQFQWLLNQPFNGLQLSTRSGWVNQYGGVKHRGFPIDISLGTVTFSTVVDAKVGAVAGICLGDPDIDAYTRLAGPVRITDTDVVDRTGALVAPYSRCVFNTQNTAYLRQFAASMFCAPGLGRHDDIIASLLTQRVMHDAGGFQVYIGPPFTYQERNHHDLLIDLKHELWGMEHLLEIADFIDSMPLKLDAIRASRYFWSNCSTLPEQAKEAGLAFLEDAETILK